MTDIKLKNHIMRLVFPVKCMNCGEITLEKAPFCSDCLPHFAELMTAKCPICDRDKNNCTCVGRKNAKFLFYYKSDISKNVVASLKYHMTTYKAKYFAGLIRMLILPNEKIDAVVYPPRSPKNRRRYGFDQSEMISKELASILGVPCLKIIKRKSRFGKNKMQKLLSAEQRVKNVSGAFYIDTSLIGGIKRVLLFDDVITTGATVGECSRLLKKAGINKVNIVSVAKTPKTLKRTRKNHGKQAFHMNY